jgi:hypothetical protein
MSKLAGSLHADGVAAGYESGHPRRDTTSPNHIIDPSYTCFHQKMIVRENERPSAHATTRGGQLRIVVSFDS